MQDFVYQFRRMGPRGLDAYLAAHGRQPSRALDRVCAQQDAHTTLLYWFTELPAAVAEARRTGRPILSLRLLGRLDEELSCANSRFFRKLLYRDPQVNQLLRERFVLHWESVRPVPKVSIDFGNGRRVERTLTGNSAHLVLDSHGRAVDVLPGLFDAQTFVSLLDQAARFARADRGHLPMLHASARRPVDAPAPARAVRASTLAMTKHRVEAPLLRAVTPIPAPGSDLEADTRQNLLLHDRIHAAFADGAEWAGLAGLVEWLYADIFEMPLSDPALGLDREDPFPLPELSYSRS